MSATSTPQFYTTAFPTTTPTYSPTQNATLPIIVVDGQATNMTTTNALIGATLALIIVAVALAAGRYLPAGWAQRFRRMIPQSTIDKFKRDPLGSVTEMVNDPKSILKSLKIPDSVMEMVPPGIKDTFLPTTEAVGVVEPEPAPEPERKVEAEPERKLTPTPEPEPELKQERVREPSPVQSKKVVFEPEATKDVVDVPVLPRTESHEIVDLGGVIVQEQKDEIRNPVTLQISADDLAEIQSMLAEKKKAHAVV
jgi:outer membrane biosynthesis protein TonB